jgi:hypothetical protein
MRQYTCAGSKVLLVNCFTGGFTAKHLALHFTNLSIKPNNNLIRGSMIPRAFRKALVNKKESDPRQLTSPGLPFPDLVRILGQLLACIRGWI